MRSDSRIHSATFGSAVNDEYRGELDAQQLTFESLLPTIAGPSGRKIVVLRLVDFCLRSLVCVSADRKLGEVFSTGWQSVFSAANWGRA
jgi:hypothetical protein